MQDEEKRTTAIITITVFESPPLPPLELSEEEGLGEFDEEVELVVVEGMAVVVVVKVPLGAGKIVMVPHRVGPQGNFKIFKKPLASPEYSIWKALLAQTPIVPPTVVAFPTEGIVQL